MDCSDSRRRILSQRVLLPRDATSSPVGTPFDIPEGKMTSGRDPLLRSHAARGARTRHALSPYRSRRRFIHSSADVHVNSLDSGDSRLQATSARRTSCGIRIIGAARPPASAGCRHPYYGASNTDDKHPSNASMNFDRDIPQAFDIAGASLALGRSGLRALGRTSGTAPSTGAHEIQILIPTRSQLKHVFHGARTPARRPRH